MNGDPAHEFVTLEEAKRRLTERLGISRSLLHKGGYVERLRARGMYLVHQRQIDGSVRLRGFRVPARVVDEIAADVKTYGGAAI